MKKTHNDSLAPKKQEHVELADIFRLYADDYRRSHESGDWGRATPSN
jgi:hypothetical protein